MQLLLPHATSCKAPLVLIDCIPKVTSWNSISRQNILSTSIRTMADHMIGRVLSTKIGRIQKLRCDVTSWVSRGRAADYQVLADAQRLTSGSHVIGLGKVSKRASMIDIARECRLACSMLGLEKHTQYLAASPACCSSFAGFHCPCRKYGTP